MKGPINFIPEKSKKLIKFFFNKLNNTNFSKLQELLQNF